MSIQLTFRQAINSGFWEEICSMYDINPKIKDFPHIYDTANTIELDVYKCLDNGVSLTKLESLLDYLDNTKLK